MGEQKKLTIAIPENKNPMIIRFFQGNPDSSTNTNKDSFDEARQLTINTIKESKKTLEKLSPEAQEKLVSIQNNKAWKTWHSQNWTEEINKVFEESIGEMPLEDKEKISLCLRISQFPLVNFRTRPEIEPTGSSFNVT